MRLSDIRLPGVQRSARVCGRIKSFADDCRGVAAVEFAVTLPILLALLFGVVEFGRYVFASSTVKFAAQEVTRFATVNYDATVDQLKNVATNRVPGIDKTKITSLDVQSVLNAADQTKLVTVAISYNHEFILPVFDIDSVTINGSSKGFLIEK